MNTRYPEGIPAIIGLASNVRGGSNPPFTISDFQQMYPQFFTTADEPEYTEEPDTPTPDAMSGDTTGDMIDGSAPAPIIPITILEGYIDLAHACVKYSRFREAWKMCMGLFAAHFATLYLETMVDPFGDTATVAKAGQAGGLMSSKSVDGVSVSYDYSQVMNDLAGWAGWKATAFGVQLATWAKMFSLGGMYIH